MHGGARARGGACRRQGGCRGCGWRHAGAAGVRGSRDGRARPCSTRARFRTGGLRGAVLLLDWRASGCIVRGSGDGANVRCRPCAPLKVGLQGQLCGRCVFAEAPSGSQDRPPRARCAPERLAARAGIRERLGQGTRGYHCYHERRWCVCETAGVALPGALRGFANNVRGIIGRWQGCSHGKRKARQERARRIAGGIAGRQDLAKPTTHHHGSTQWPSAGTPSQPPAACGRRR